jgi:putative ABC transport system permease protein
MLRNFLLSASRNFYKNGVYSLINIFGLSVGLAAFILLSLFVRFESSYDTYHDDHERIYRVDQLVSSAYETRSWNQVPAPVSVELENSYAEVEEAIAIRAIWGEYLSTSKERTFLDEDGYYANPDIFNLFKIIFIAGNKETALDAPMKIVLTESLANKLFPDSDPLGQNILVDSKRTYQVSAVIKDYPFNSDSRPSYFISFETYKSIYNEDYFDHWDWHHSKVYLKLRKGVDAKIFESKIKNLLDEFIEDRDEEIQLKPIWIIHLYNSTEDGYWITIILYGILGLLILLLAAINFINLTTAYSLTRAKEIGVKKIVGSSRFSLMSQFLGESLIVVFISLLVAFTITEATLPIFNRIVSVPLDMRYIEDWQFTLFIVGITSFTGILSGLYPALVLSSINPLTIIKNQLFDSNRFKKFSMRRGLIVFQLVMSIMLVLITFNLLGLFNYFQNKDLGFDKQNLLICGIKETEKVKINEFSALRNDLLQIPNVEEASLSYNTPFYGSSGQTMNWEGAPEGEEMTCRYNRAYATFLNTLKIDLLAGRHFDANRTADSSACIVNETFVSAAGWSLDEAIGKRVWDLKYTIIGVTKDFHVKSPFSKISPYFLFNHPGYLTGNKIIDIRVRDASNKETIKKIKIILEDYFPESNFEIGPFDENKNNGNTNKVLSAMGKTFGFFTVVSIVIAIIGLFALVSFSSKRKVKEIGIRKVLGATSSQIYGKLAKEYLVLIFIANLIAIPLGILFGKGVPSYYKPADNYSQIFWIALLSIVITLLTISIQVIKSSRANPVESLRYE